jgi:outer membrane protein
MKLRVLCFVLLATSCFAQEIHQRETYGTLKSAQITADKLPAAKYLQDHVVNGKLRLSLQDAIISTLMNNTDVRLQELNVENSKFSLLRAHSPFDPSLQGSFNGLREVSPANSQLQGAATPNFLTQTTHLNYNQLFETGTNVLVGFDSTKLSTNNSNNFINPSISSTLNFQITQPLLRNRWLSANRAPLVIARRNLRISRANFEAQVSTSIFNVVSQYWNVVEARGNLDVAQKFQNATEASYNRDKRALELGALPPLDIYQSESRLASRRVFTIQSEYALKQAEDQLRATLGAMVDPFLRALDLELTELPAHEEELLNIDQETALKEALEGRPEIEALRQALANDDTNIRFAHNNLLPDLRLGANYSGNGLSGSPGGGFGDSLNQTFGFGFPSYGVSLTLNLPIRNRAAQADLGMAFVSRRHDLYSERQLREQITLEVSNAVHLLEQAKLSIAASQEALDLSRKNLIAEQRKHELGSGDVFFVLEAQTEVAEAESSVLQAQVAYQLAVAAVEHATGKLFQPFHIKINELMK